MLQQHWLPWHSSPSPSLPPPPAWEPPPQQCPASSSLGSSQDGSRTAGFGSAATLATRMPVTGTAASPPAVQQLPWEFQELPPPPPPSLESVRWQQLVVVSAAFPAGITAWARERQRKPRPNWQHRLFRQQLPPQHRRQPPHQQPSMCMSSQDPSSSLASTWATQFLMDMDLTASTASHL